MQFLAALYAAERPHWDNRAYAMDSAIKAMGQAMNAFAEAEKKQEPEISEKMIADIRGGTKKQLSHDFMEFLDAHRYEGKMCLSNGECKNIEDAFVKADWDMIGRYYNKYIQEPANRGNSETPKEWTEKDERIRKEMIAYAKNLKDIAQSGRTGARSTTLDVPSTLRPMVIRM